MFVVTVNFVINKDHIDEFERVMKQQARNSLRDERGCLQFDVCSDPKNRCRVFLYEVYREFRCLCSTSENETFYQF